jgi:hypothetical protein
MRPRVVALARAAELAEQSAQSDPRLALEALRLKRELQAELERVPGVPRSRRSDKTWRHW